MEMATMADPRICLSDSTEASKRQQTLAELVEKHRVRLLGIIRERMQDQIEAEDVLHDVFIEFVEAYDLGYAIETVSAWLVRVAKNKIVDRFRRRKTQAEYRNAVLATGERGENLPSRPDEEWMRSWLRNRIVDALELLPPQQRDVFVKHELEGKTFAEIAAESRVSVNTLLSRKRYAVLFLRNQLKEIYDELE
jgi:RNA polymerase sigma factor (sigma-70 family)